VTSQLSDTPGALTDPKSAAGSYRHPGAQPVGDVLITQVHPATTSSRRIRSALDALGLRYVGHTVLHDSRTDPRLHLKLHAVRDLISVQPLAMIDGGPGDSYLGSHALNEICETRYFVNDRPAKTFEISEDEYFEVEVHDGFVAMSWPTAIPLPLLLQRFEAVAPPTCPDKAVLYSRVNGRELHEGEPGIDALHSDPADYIFARLEYADFTVTWKSGNSAAGFEDSVTYGEFGWLSRLYSRTDVKALLRDTATAGIGLRADELSNRTDFVKKYIEEGSVLQLDKTS